MEARKRKRCTYVTAPQKQRLFEIMSKHPELVSCKVTQGFSYKDSQNLWQRIATECNAMQGAKKTWRQWKKTWHDLRSKAKKRQAETNGDHPVSTVTLTVAEQEALGIKVLPGSEYQGSTEFVPLEENSQEEFNLEESGSLSELDSPLEERTFHSSPVQKKKLKNSKHKCYFNCDVIAGQEQKKIRIKEEYLNFKKDYLRQKLKLMKEQTEALKSIAKELLK